METICKPLILIAPLGDMLLALALTELCFQLCEWALLVLVRQAASADVMSV